MDRSMDKIDVGFVLAAGLGTRMKPSPNDPPKPLMKIGNTSLLGHILGQLEAVGVERIIVNCHHKAEQIISHIHHYEGRAKIFISDERARLLDSGGGFEKARYEFPDLFQKPLFVCNADGFFYQDDKAFSPLLQHYHNDGNKMDGLLYLTKKHQTKGYDGLGDFIAKDNAKDNPQRAHIDETKPFAIQLSTSSSIPSPYIYAGIQILNPKMCRAPNIKIFSLRHYWQDKSFGLFGCLCPTNWIHVGTPQALQLAQQLTKMSSSQNGKHHIHNTNHTNHTNHIIYTSYTKHTSYINDI